MSAREALEYGLIVCKKIKNVLTISVFGSNINNNYYEIYERN